MTPVDYQQLIALRQSALSNYLAAAVPASGSFVWEIGCGHGHFLNAYAAAHQHQTCIGIDLISERIERAVRKRDRAGHAGLHFLLADARLFLAALPAHARISATYILFPDPWPKLRHHKHRIIAPAFLTALRGRVEEGARLFFRTDHAAYFEAAHTTLNAHPDWEIIDEAWPFESETVFQQRAERYQSIVARPAGPARAATECCK